MSSILFRQIFPEEEELRSSKKYFDVFENRSSCPAGEIIGRYSVLPFYRELSLDLESRGSWLVNSPAQHNWIANFDYYLELEKYTFKTWNEREFSSCGYAGPFVVKGRTNSYKHKWNKKMYARNKEEASRIACELMDDPLIAQQGIIFRKYEKLKTYEIGINELPFTNEWRIFYYKGRRVAFGYYWAIAEDIDTPSFDKNMIALADEIASIAKKFTNFFVLDMAQKEDGSWILVEVNDGQMSGLSTIDADNFYENLKKVILT